MWFRRRRVTQIYHSITIQSWHPYLIAKNCLGNVDVQVKKNIISFTAEIEVVFNFDLKIEVTIWTTIYPWLPFASQADLDTIGYAWWDGNHLGNRFPFQPAAVTGRAGGIDYLASPVAAGSGDNLDH